jgi:hypothetical protein
VKRGIFHFYGFIKKVYKTVKISSLRIAFHNHKTIMVDKDTGLLLTADISATSF